MHLWPIGILSRILLSLSKARQEPGLKSVQGVNAKRVHLGDFGSFICSLLAHRNDLIRCVSLGTGQSQCLSFKETNLVINSYTENSTERVFVSQSGHGHASDILTVQVGRPSIIVRAPNLILLQDRNGVIPDNGLQGNTK